jgi:hypothetical protein
MDPELLHERAKHAVAARYTPKSYIRQLRRQLDKLTDDDKRALAELLAAALSAPSSGGEAA